LDSFSVNTYNWETWNI